MLNVVVNVKAEKKNPIGKKDPWLQLGKRNNRGIG